MTKPIWEVLRELGESVPAEAWEKLSGKAEIRPNEGAQVDANGRCENADEVIGNGFLHVEQMDAKCYWARLDLPDGKAVVMWFTSESPINLIAEWD